jgi:D-serine deaminase-like pyridoxal phosphate-dependent protein
MAERAPSMRSVHLHYDGAPAAIGAPGSRREIPTPALVCDLDLLEANVAAMAAAAEAGGFALRPHAKSHKCAGVAQLQLDAGASGIACAKLAEAEVLVDRLATTATAAAGTARLSVLLTSPVVGSAPARRAAALAGRCTLTVAVDHPDGVRELAGACDRAGTSAGVVCDVDVGLGRTGVTGPDGAVAVATAVASSTALHLDGVQGYAGHLQHVPGREARRAAVVAAGRRLAAVVGALEDAGHEVVLRTGGGTGSFLLDAEQGLLTEIQAGSYVFMDREYRDALGDDPEGRFAQSLTVATTVVSANQEGFVTVDAGLKAMATDAGPPGVVGSPDGVGYAFFGDEHGLVTTTGAVRYARGDRLELVPPHCDPTVDRYDRLWLVRGDVLVGWTPVDARGRST